MRRKIKSFSQFKGSATPRVLSSVESAIGRDICFPLEVAAAESNTTETVRRSTTSAQRASQLAEDVEAAARVARKGSQEVETRATEVKAGMASKLRQAKENISARLQGYSDASSNAIDLAKAFIDQEVGDVKTPLTTDLAPTINTITKELGNKVKTWDAGLGDLEYNLTTLEQSVAKYMGGHRELAMIEEAAKQAIEDAQTNLEKNKKGRNETKKSRRRASGGPSP